MATMNPALISIVAAIVTLLVFTLPGLLAYYWINLFGITPSSKREQYEVVALSALLWLPIIIIVIAIYNHRGFLEFAVPRGDRVGTIPDLIEVSSNLSFLLYFVIATVITSFVVALLFTTLGYKALLWIVNSIRKKANVAPLSRYTTVWDDAFSGYNAKIVEYSQMGIPEEEFEKKVGVTVKMPRAHEPVKALVLKDEEYWKNVLRYASENGSPVKVAEVYIDLEKNYKITIYDENSILESHKAYKKYLNNK